MAVLGLQSFLMITLILTMREQRHRWETSQRWPCKSLVPDGTDSQRPLLPVLQLIACVSFFFWLCTLYTFLKHINSMHLSRVWMWLDPSEARLKPETRLNEMTFWMSAQCGSLSVWLRILLVSLICHPVSFHKKMCFPEIANRMLLWSHATYRTSENSVFYRWSEHHCWVCQALKAQAKTLPLILLYSYY